MPLFWTWAAELSWVALCCLLTQTQVCCLFCARTWAIQHFNLLCFEFKSSKVPSGGVGTRPWACFCAIARLPRFDHLWHLFAFTIVSIMDEWDARSESDVLLNSCLVWLCLCLLFFFKNQHLKLSPLDKKIKNKKNTKLNNEELFFLPTIKHFKGLLLCSTFDSSSFDAQLSKEIP